MDTSEYWQAWYDLTCLETTKKITEEEYIRVRDMLSSTDEELNDLAVTIIKDKIQKDLNKL